MTLEYTRELVALVKRGDPRDHQATSDRKREGAFNESFVVAKETAAHGLEGCEGR